MRILSTLFLSIVMMVAILMPAIVKLSHAIYDHQEQLCLDKNSEHVHEVELDCEFLKFKLFPQQYHIFVNFQKVEIPSLKQREFDHYAFLNKFQKLHFDSRGPPIS